MLLKQMKPEEFDAVYDLMEKVFPLMNIGHMKNRKNCCRFLPFRFMWRKKRTVRISRDLRQFGILTGWSISSIWL